MGGCSVPSGIIPCNESNIAHRTLDVSYSKGVQPQTRRTESITETRVCVCVFDRDEFEEHFNM